MVASIDHTTDSSTSKRIDAIVEQIIGQLQAADAQGVRFLTARDLYRNSYGPLLRVALRRTEEAHRTASRRSRVGEKRRRYVALPHNARFLPGGVR